MKRIFLGLFLIATLAGCGVDWFPENSGALTITTTTLPNGAGGTAYSQTLTASGGKAPYTWTLASGSLPTGLQLSTAGVISGTPTTAGASTFSVKVTDSSTTPQSATQSLTLTISGSISPTTLPAGTVGTAYSQQLSATGSSGTFTYAVTSGSLPAGLTLSSTGLLSGTPTTAATSTFTVTATDNSTPAFTVIQSFTLTVTT